MIATKTRAAIYERRNNTAGKASTFSANTSTMRVDPVDLNQVAWTDPTDDDLVHVSTVAEFKRKLREGDAK